MILFLNMRVISMFAVSKMVMSALVTWLELETDDNMLIICYSKFFILFKNVMRCSPIPLILSSRVFFLAYLCLSSFQHVTAIV